MQIATLTGMLPSDLQDKVFEMGNAGDLKYRKVRDAIVGNMNNRARVLEPTPMDIGQVGGPVRERAEVEVQRWMDVMLVEEEQIELKDCESTFVEERELDPERVKEARLEEVQFMQKKRLLDVVPWPKDGCPVSLRWVDVVKGDGLTWIRLVARDFKGLDRHAATPPPLEAVRAVLSMAATKSSNGPVKKVMMIDAKKAHLNPRCKEDVYIELPPEVGAELGQCGKPNFWLYGFRKAASAWEDFYAKVMEEAGFRRGVGCSVIFRHEEKDLFGVVHGDDFVFGGNDEDLKWVAKGSCSQVRHQSEGFSGSRR